MAMFSSWQVSELPRLFRLSKETKQASLIAKLPNDVGSLNNTSQHLSEFQNENPRKLLR